MIERFAIALLLISLSVALFLALRRSHLRRASRNGGLTRGPGAAGRNRPTLLYFRSDHCAPCETQQYYLEQVERAYNGRLSIQQVDADADPEKAARFGVFTLPTTLVVDRDGQVRHINYGLTAAAKLASQLERVV